MLLNVRLVICVFACTILFTTPCTLVVTGNAPSGNVTALLPGTPPADQLPGVDQFWSAPAPPHVLWAVAIRTLGDPEEAADALQDAMISAFRRAGSFRGDSAVTTWLHRIVVNAALDRMRRRSARPTAGGGDEEVLDSIASSRNPQSDPSGASDTQLDVQAALRRLVPEQQAALVLVDMLGYSVADAADVLGVSEKHLQLCLGFVDVAHQLAGMHRLVGRRLQIFQPGVERGVVFRGVWMRPSKIFL